MLRAAVANLLLLLADATPDGELFISPPEQVSIASGLRADTQVSITWLTNDTRDDESSCNEVAYVEVRLGSSGPQQIVGECLRYHFSTAPDLYGNYTSGRIHRVHLTRLHPDSSYSYRIAGDSETMERSFKTMPPTTNSISSSGSDLRYPFAFGVLGDLGQTRYSKETVKHIEADDEIQLILHAGDMSYADTNATRWDSYGRMVEPVSSRVQWMVCPGNHEIESDYYSGISFIPYEARFVMPAVKAPEFKPSAHQVGCRKPYPPIEQKEADCTPSVFTGSYDWGNSFYAFTVGPARVISLNSYTETSQDSPQYQWLKAELEALRATRDLTPWLIVMMHCPFYNSNEAHKDERQAVEMQSHGFEDLFKQHNVSIVLSGHVHAYERSHPVYKNEVVESGPSYVVIGDGGNREGHADSYQPQPDWSAYRNGVAYGYGKIILENSTHMRWEWYPNAATATATQLKKGQDSSRLAERRFSRQLYSSVAEDSAWIINPQTVSSQPDPDHNQPTSPNGNEGWKVALAVLLGTLLLAVVVGFAMRLRKRNTGSALRGTELDRMG